PAPRTASKSSFDGEPSRSYLSFLGTQTGRGGLRRAPPGVLEDTGALAIVWSRPSVGLVRSARSWFAAAGITAARRPSPGLVMWTAARDPASARTSRHQP